MNQGFDYTLEPEKIAAYMQLSAEEKLQWLEEIQRIYRSNALTEKTRRIRDHFRNGPPKKNDTLPNCLNVCFISAFRKSHLSLINSSFIIHFDGTQRSERILKSGCSCKFALKYHPWSFISLLCMNFYRQTKYSYRHPASHVSNGSDYPGRVCRSGPEKVRHGNFSALPVYRPAPHIKRPGN